MKSRISLYAERSWAFTKMRKSSAKQSFLVLERDMLPYVFMISLRFGSVHFFKMASLLTGNSK